MLKEYIEQTENFIFAEDELRPADVIFLPGNGYPQMAERAAELYKEGFAPYILPSGRYSITEGHFAGVQAKAEIYSDTYETEWDFLRDVLRKNGVPDHAILKENEATYTYENALRSKEVLEKENLEVSTAILCCKTHHARRALMYYQSVFPETEILVCPVNADGITKENWKKSEEGIAAVMGEATRVIRQFSLLMKETPVRKR
jgi:uncharacterized SAM-binding protein YcdF (DUF218 family)